VINRLLLYSAVAVRQGPNIAVICFKCKT